MTRRRKFLLIVAAALLVVMSIGGWVYASADAAGEVQVTAGDGVRCSDPASLKGKRVRSNVPAWPRFVIDERSVVVWTRLVATEDCVPGDLRVRSVGVPEVTIKALGRSHHRPTAEAVLAWRGARGETCGI